MNNTAEALNYAETFEDIKKLGGNTAQIISGITISSVKEIKDAIAFYKEELAYSTDESYKAICTNQKDLLLRIMIAKVRLTGSLLGIKKVTEDIESDLSDISTNNNLNIKENKNFDKEAIIEERKNKGKILDIKGKIISTFNNNKNQEEKNSDSNKNKETEPMLLENIEKKCIILLKNPKVEENKIIDFLKNTLGEGNYKTDKNFSKEVVTSKKWSEKEITTFLTKAKEKMHSELADEKEAKKENTSKTEDKKVIPITDSLKDTKADVKPEVKAEVKENKEKDVNLKFQDVYEEGKTKIKNNESVKDIMDWFVNIVLNNNISGVKLKENTEFEAKSIFYNIFTSAFNSKDQEIAKADLLKLKKENSEKWNDESIKADLIEVAKTLDYKKDGSLAKVCMKLRSKYNPLKEKNKVEITEIKDMLKPLIEEHNADYWKSYQELLNINVPLAKKAEQTVKEEKKSDSSSETKDSSSNTETKSLEKEVAVTGNPTSQEKNTSSKDNTSQVKEDNKKEEISSPETKNDIPEQKTDTPVATPTENVQTASKEEVKKTDVQPEKNTEITSSTEPGVKIASKIYGNLKNEKELYTILDKCDDYKKMTDLAKKLNELSKSGNFKDAMSVLYHYTITKNQIEDFKDMDLKQVETFYKVNFHDKYLNEINKKREESKSNKDESNVSDSNTEFGSILSSKDKKEFQTSVLDYLLKSEIETEKGDKEVDKTKLSILVNSLLDRSDINSRGKYARRISRNKKADVYRMINNIYINFKES